MKTNKKVIIITGATKGLGKELTCYLTSFDYNIAVLSRGIDFKETDILLQFPVNIKNKKEIVTFIDKVYSKWGRIDILINNAGVVNLKSIKDYSEEDYYNIFDVNVKGAFLMTQSVIPYMKNGYIINIGSTRSITGAPNKSLYSMSKFALRSLTQCINQEFKNIRSSIVCPGRLGRGKNKDKLVQMNEVAQIVKYLIDSPKSNHIPEIIIGGQL